MKNSQADLGVLLMQSGRAKNKDPVNLKSGL